MIILRGHPAPRGIRRAVIAAVLSAVVLAGCGAAEKLSPRVAVREAAERTANQKEGTFRLSVVGSENDLNALFNDGAPLTDEDRAGLDILRNGHIAISTAKDRFGLDVKAGDLEHAFELRYIDRKLYARADIAGLAKLFSESPDEINKTLSELASQDGFGFISAAAAGQWIVADLSTVTGLFDNLRRQFGGDTESSTPAPTGAEKLPSEFQALKDAVGKALSEDVSIKELKSDDAGDHYLATVSSLRGFYAKVRPALAQQQTMPFGGQLPEVGDVPDKPASLDVWVKGGRVSRLELDLAQLAGTTPAPNTGRVALRLDIDREAAGVTAPSDAVSVDVAGLLGKLFSQFGSSLEGVGGGLTEYD
ncbi:MAG: hypothetical protein AB1679_13615 [Actinomycetota bacterium]|jgi:hypothetical protein